MFSEEESLTLWVSARPFYSVIDKAKIKSILGIETPNWSESLLKALKAIILRNK